MKIRIEGRIARIKAINLFGGKLVKAAYALEISRITCLYLPDRESDINRNKNNARRT